MYETHFGFRQRPFRPVPDTSCYYPATSHEQALTRLQQALAEEEGLVLLTSGPGLGKTLLCRCLLKRLGEEVVSAFLTNSHFSSRAGFLQAILFDLSLPFEGRSEQALRLALTDYLLTQYASGKKTILIVDEAQYLTADLLEELRLLGNLEARQGKALQVVLAAQPFLSETLGLAELASFRQRLAVRLALEPMNVDEAADYLVHRAADGGGPAPGHHGRRGSGPAGPGGRGYSATTESSSPPGSVPDLHGRRHQVDAEAVLEALNMLDLEMPADPEAQDTDSESLEATEQTLSLPQSQPPPRTFAS